MSDIELFVDCENDDEQIKSYKYKTLRGETKSKSKSNKYVRKEVYIQNLYDLYKQNIIIIPSFQRKLNIDKVILMTKTYEIDNEIFIFVTNPIQLVYIEELNKYFLIDGQHRFNMYINTFEKNQKDFQININIINENDINKILQLYSNLNIDNPDICSSDLIDIFKMHQYIKLRDNLYKNYKKCFIENNQYIYSISNFIKILQDASYMDAFNNVEDATIYIKRVNKIFYNKFYTNDTLDRIKLNKDELNMIKLRKIFTIKNNNFINLLVYTNIDEYTEKYKFSHSWKDKTTHLYSIDAEPVSSEAFSE